MRRRSGVRRPISSKPETYRERCDVYPTGISVKVVRHTRGDLQGCFVLLVTADLKLTTSGWLCRSAGDHGHHSTVTGQYAIGTGGQFGGGGNTLGLYNIQRDRLNSEAEKPRIKIFHKQAIYDRGVANDRLQSGRKQGVAHSSRVRSCGQPLSLVAENSLS